MSWSLRASRVRVASITACAAVVLATPATAVVPATAAPVPTPAAPPCITETRNNPITAFTSYAELDKSYIAPVAPLSREGWEAAFPLLEEGY